VSFEGLIDRGATRDTIRRTDQSVRNVRWYDEATRLSNFRRTEVFSFGDFSIMRSVGSATSDVKILGLKLSAQMDRTTRNELDSCHAMVT
jgi:hypothetical protein